MQLGAVVEDMKGRGVKEIGKGTFREIAASIGIISDPVTIGRMMKRMGIEDRISSGTQEGLYYL